MALFKILKGPEAALPTTKKEGWAYVTNEGNFYVDISDTLRVKINSNADFSSKAENDSSNQKITDTYIKDVIYNPSGTAPYYTLKLGNGNLKATNGVTDKVIIPVANTTDAGVVTIGKQTFAGAKTFNALITAKLGLTADENISTAKQLISTIENGTAPLVVSSKTLVTNLNADTVDGLHASNNLFNAENSSTTILPTQRAIWSSLNDLLVAAHALVYRGIIDPTDSKTHPASGKVGDVYIISKEGTFAGVYCEPGDMAIYYASGWDIVQVNINGAVVIKDGGAYNSAHTTTNAISRFEDTTGRVIKNSKVIIDDTGNMTPVNKNTQNLGSKENIWNTIYGSTFTGTSKQAISDDQGQVIKNFYLQDVVLNTSASAPYYTLKLGNGLFKDTDGTSGADKVIIPVASTTQAGVITADTNNAQTITGAKIIDSKGSLEIKKAEGFKYSGIQTASATGARSVWFSLLNSSGTPCINNSFKFDPDETLNITNWSNEKSGTKSSVLHVPHIEGLAYKALRDSQGLVIDDTYIKDVVLTNNATAPYYTLTLGNGLSKANADGTNQKVLLPVAGQNYAGVITNAAQSISGKKTFLDGIAIKLTTTNTNATYYPWFSTVDSGGIGTPVYDTNFNYNANTNKLTATTFAGSLEGNAATATALTTSAGSTTQPIYFSGGKPVAITGSIANNTTGNAATATKLATARTLTIGNTGKSFNGTANVSWSRDEIGCSYGHHTTWDFTKAYSGQYVTFDVSAPSGGPGGWINAFVSTHNNYLSSFIANVHRSGDWYVGYSEHNSTTNVNPTWYKLLHTGNYTKTLDGRYVKKSGDTMTGTLANSTVKGGSWIIGTHECTFFSKNATTASAGSFYQGHYGLKTPSGAWSLGILSGSNDLYFVYGTDANYTSGSNNANTTVRIAPNGGIYGAVWNDYAEFRICNENFKPGQVVRENGDDTLSIASQRLQRGCSIVSDTFGFAIGETDEAKCPIAVSGRVLAYGYESREEFKKHIGWPVCSGPNGTVSIMTEEEEEKYPSRIIGTVSAVPDYETWGTDNVKVDGRIWIKVR